MTTPPESEATPEFIEKIRQRPIDGFALKNLASAGLTWLRTNQELVNALNVFPVPDGDTGTNMVLTMQSAFDEIKDSPEEHVGKTANDLAQGALMGARGNSGVILSQIWRGFARALDGHEVIDAPTLASAFAAARDTAYKGVVRPVEGTILTVAKDIASAAEAALENTQDPFEILEIVVEEAAASVERTPDLLDVLKDAGVVDSGGKGLYFIIEGMLRFSKGMPLDTAVASVKPLSALNFDDAMQTVEPGQDYEVVVDFRPTESLNLEKYFDALEDMGTSIQIGEGDGMYRMHIHVPTEKRYEPIDYTMGIGTITKVHIENLLAQMDELEKQRQEQPLKLTPVEPGQIAVVTVAPGPGFANVFASLGAAAIVEGGQTMNPSTQDILASFENLPTDKVIILPNNKNIIMAAKAATEVTVKQTAVIPSRTVPQGVSALLRLIPDGDFDAVVEDMTSALEDIETGEITTATRTVEIDGVNVQEGEIIVLHNGKLILSSDNLQNACFSFLEQADANEYELITMFYGVDIPKTEAFRIGDLIRETYPDHEIEVQNGGQPHYQFIISIE
ncbi:MAG: DAK2 domain-containing protein [Anaerolineales bacterium]|nr:DAK2 domain-containing protein [Chloroflexota bacterium]MBL6980724.1 DAK2 domain-containing protein [Anaerolineales bacterium]